VADRADARARRDRRDLCRAGVHGDDLVADCEQAVEAGAERVGVAAVDDEAAELHAATIAGCVKLCEEAL